MKTTDNKTFLALAITNIVAFIIIFVLVWLLWESNKDTQKASSAVTEEALVVKVTDKQEKQALGDESQQIRDQNKSFLKQKVLSTFELVMQEVKAADLNIGAFNTTDSKLINKDTDQRAYQNAPQNIDENEESADTGLSDKAYISAFNQLDKQAPPERQYTEEQVSTVQVITSLDDTTTKNNFNKVDVSQYRSDELLTKQLAVIVSNTEPTQNPDSDVASSTSGWKDYLNSIKSAEAERKNEMRTIKVRQGDTLWRIATRAYGTGFLYMKIFKANPHLLNPAAIAEGETLRVPL